MAIPLRRIFLVVSLVLILLLALLSWSIVAAHSASHFQQGSRVGSHSLAYTCPPPPRYC